MSLIDYLSNLIIGPTTNPYRFAFDENNRLIYTNKYSDYAKYVEYLNTLSPENRNLVGRFNRLYTTPEAANKAVNTYNANIEATVPNPTVPNNTVSNNALTDNALTDTALTNTALTDNPLSSFDKRSADLASGKLVPEGKTILDFLYDPQYSGTGANGAVSPNNAGLANMELSDWAKFTGAMGDINKAIIAPAKDLMSTYTAWKGYEQARKEYDLNRSLVNQNLANQASMINRNIDASANIAAQQSGLYGNSAAIQQYNNQLRNDTLANANANKIKHNPL